jgi:transcriptional regulator with XRE-family HTH domain
VGDASPHPQEPRVPADTFAVRLLLLRHELALTVDEVSARCGVPSATWSTWERGARPRDLAAVVNRIAERTGYSRDWLMWGGGLALSGQVELSVIPGQIEERIVGQDELPLWRPHLTIHH